MIGGTPSFFKLLLTGSYPKHCHKVWVQDGESMKSYNLFLVLLVYLFVSGCATDNRSEELVDEEGTPWVNDFRRDTDGSIWLVQATFETGQTIRFQDRSYSVPDLLEHLRTFNLRKGTGVRIMTTPDLAEKEPSVLGYIMMTFRGEGYLISFGTHRQMLKGRTTP